jgi:predicted nucleic acid-binding protein
MLSVIDTELWLSAVVETEDTVGAVVSVVDALSEDAVVVVDAPSSLLLLQEMTVRLKRDMRIMYKILFIFLLYK